MYKDEKEKCVNQSRSEAIEYCVEYIYFSLAELQIFTNLVTENDMFSISQFPGDQPW